MDQPASRRSSRPTTSPTGWWIAGLLQKNPDTDRAPFWNNYTLVRATDWRTAFRKATEMGQSNAETVNAAFGAGHEFIGVSDLAPIYDKFEEGAEILWEEIWPDAGTRDECPIGIYTEAELESHFEEPPEAGEETDSHRPHPQ